jgi:ketosteroid isomerase-like protein
VNLARPLYHPEVLYLSPTVRLFGWPRRVEGIEKTLEFIGLTVQNCPSIRYEAVESACLPDGTSAFVRVHFDWNHGDQRLRSNYVVLYRYREGLIAQQEIYYDPSGSLEKLGPASVGTRT